MTARRLALGLAWIGVLLLAFGYLGAVSRPAESLALLRPLCAVLALLGLVVARARLARLTFLGAICAALITVLPPFFSGPQTGELRIYSKNLHIGNTQVAAIAKDISDADVELVMLQELSPRNEAILGLLSAEFPHQHRCHFAERWLGMAVLSRHPFAGEPLCSDHRALAAAPVVLNGQRSWAVSVHAPWPWPKQTAHNEAALRELLVRLDGPIVMAGDVNSLPWTHRVTFLQSLTGTRMAGPARASFHLGPLPLPIDLAFAPGGGSIALRPQLGSDHAGILAKLSLAPN